jgi:hypothetical protein
MHVGIEAWCFLLIFLTSLIQKLGLIKAMSRICRSSSLFALRASVIVDGDSSGVE